MVIAALALTAAAYADTVPDGPGGPRIAVINQSEVSNSALASYLPYFQQYVNQVCQAWHCNGTLYMASAPARSSDWSLTLVDISAIAGALGWHQTTTTGVPELFVAVKTSVQNGVHWGAVMAHEIAETLVDPTASAAANTTCDTDPGTGNQVNCTFYSYEVGDPVQGETYRLGPVTVEDFIYRSWFTPGAPGPYDAMRKTSAPLTMAPSSYISFYANGAWQEADTFPASMSRARKALLERQ